MKTQFIYLILLFTTFNNAQQLSGLEDILLASSKETVIKEMMSLENVKLDFERDDVLGFQGGEFNSHKVYFWSFHFFDDQLHTVDVVFKRPDVLNRLRDNIVNYITEKYGVKNSERLDDNGNLANTWYFEDEKHIPTDLINLILYETSTGETTYTLTFVNLKLFEESEQKNEQGKE